MSNNFVSDISNEIIQLLELEYYDGIYDSINGEIIDISDESDATNKENRTTNLQTDILVLNSILLKNISSYVNSDMKNKSKLSDEDKNKNDTFAEQSKSSKKNLFQQYIFLIMKIFVLLMLLIVMYYKIVAPTNKMIPGKVKNIIPSSV
tara:strand:+ start:11515 stop:11961 length:447 start_codon:yes stop_codon:yes gene_type:complete